MTCVIGISMHLAYAAFTTYHKSSQLVSHHAFFVITTSESTLSVWYKAFCTLPQLLRSRLHTCHKSYIKTLPSSPLVKRTSEASPIQRTAARFAPRPYLTEPSSREWTRSMPSPAPLKHTGSMCMHMCMTLSRKRVQSCIGKIKNHDANICIYIYIYTHTHKHTHTHPHTHLHTYICMSAAIRYRWWIYIMLYNTWLISHVHMREDCKN